MKGTLTGGDAWAALSDWEKREAATDLVTKVLYPPPSARFAAKRKDVEWRRKKAVSALLATETADQLDQLVTAVLKGDVAANQREIEMLAAPLLSKWQDRWISNLYFAGSPSFYDSKKPKEMWVELKHLYLIAVSLVRQHNEIAKGRSRLEEAGKRRAIWTVCATYPVDCEYKRAAKGLQETVSKLEPVWPLACGLLHCMAVKYTGTDELLGSLHDLLPIEPPKARELIAHFLATPDVVLGAARYFQRELSAKGRVDHQDSPPLDASQCIPLPNYSDLQQTFEVPGFLSGLTAKEAKVAKDYRAKKFDAPRKPRAKKA